MYSLFQRSFLAFLAGYTVLLVILGGSIAIGYRQSMQAWSAQRSGMIEQSARELLREHAGERRGMGPQSQAHPRSPGHAGMPGDTPFFVYDTDGNVIASSLPEGRRRELSVPDERRPIRSEDRILGYYAAAPAAFRNDAANRALTEALLRAAAAGIALGIAAALAAAWGFSRSLAAPAARVASGIDLIAHGSLAAPIPGGRTREIARIAQAANLLAQRLRSEQQLRSQWAQDVTHDLRTPVASIRTQLEAIVDGVYPLEPARISGTLQELARVEHLIADLDELMRLEEPGRPLQTDRIPAAGFTDALRQRFELELQQRSLEWRTSPGISEFIGDHDLLLRAVSNLIANAIRHAAPASTIDLEITGSRESVRLLVRNQGEVVPDEEIPHLFERLYRGEYARGTAGSGLGLTIARRIAELHHGSISMHSSRASGTVVTIEIPQHPASFTESS
ncbi:HAMP domain-containing sensor histidine kinase [Spirochaeta africana]|uniref:Signal transduction histidine-protein kinase/phosphatase MprB n=1 Tax=Spirochaeta africana (strain ATCC 700263 / DSM 8902 / Z-7692) TaxID=889378 RepID=H9ULF6_SPIAZ|nr:HAMP domain-containing sensor histidine kinase [Spirochaeta africana]AFG38349.1 signal transduction histidine kinase [Spirochaeta africana DSM 8902]